MGHAVYTLSDPRAVILKKKAFELAKDTEFEKEFNLINNIEKLTPIIFKELKDSDKVMCANVDLYSGFALRKYCEHFVKTVLQKRLTESKRYAILIACCILYTIRNPQEALQSLYRFPATATITHIFHPINRKQPKRIFQRKELNAERYSQISFCEIHE